MSYRHQAESVGELGGLEARKHHRRVGHGCSKLLAANITCGVLGIQFTYNPFTRIGFLRLPHP